MSGAGFKDRGQGVKAPGFEEGKERKEM